MFSVSRSNPCVRQAACQGGPEHRQGTIGTRSTIKTKSTHASMGDEEAEQHDDVPTACDGVATTLGTGAYDSS